MKNFLCSVFLHVNDFGFLSLWLRWHQSTKTSISCALLLQSVAFCVSVSYLPPLTVTVLCPLFWLCLIRFIMTYLGFWGQQNYPWSWVVWCPPGLSCPSSMSLSGTFGPVRQPSDWRPHTGPGFVTKRTMMKPSIGRSHCCGPCLLPAPLLPSSGPQLQPSCCSPPARHAWICSLSGTGGGGRCQRGFSWWFTKIIYVYISTSSRNWSYSINCLQKIPKQIIFLPTVSEHRIMVKSDLHATLYFYQKSP